MGPVMCGSSGEGDGPCAVTMAGTDGGLGSRRKAPHPRALPPPTPRRPTAPRPSTEAMGWPRLQGHLPGPLSPAAAPRPLSGNLGDHAGLMARPAHLCPPLPRMDGVHEGLSTPVSLRGSVARKSATRGGCLPSSRRPYCGGLGREHFHSRSQRMNPARGSHGRSEGGRPGPRGRGAADPRATLGTRAACWVARSSRGAGTRASSGAGSRSGPAGCPHRPGCLPSSSTGRIRRRPTRPGVRRTGVSFPSVSLLSDACPVRVAHDLGWSSLVGTARRCG